MTRYQAVLIAPDGGDYVTDHKRDTVGDVWNAVNDQGSKWFFYPLSFVVTATGGPIMRKRIVSACDGFEWLQGCTVKTAMHEIAHDREYVAATLS